MDIKAYILWGGGALIFLVVAHAMWIRWRARRSAAAAADADALAREDLASLEEDGKEEAILFGEDSPSAIVNGRIEPAVRPPEQTELYLGETPKGAAPPRRGRKLVIAGKRTEPTVARAARDAQANAPEPPEEEPQSEEEGPGEVIVLWVTARAGGAFDGRSLVEALTANGLEYDREIFRRPDPNTRVERYQVANGVEPGTFDLSDIDAMTTPRIALILRFSLHADPAESFEDMLNAAQDIAASLNADLKDELMSDMCGQTVEHYRQRVRDYKRMSIRQ